MYDQVIEKNTITFIMNIYADIKKVTQIPQTNENPLFIRRKEQNALKKNRKLKKYKPPQNADLFDYDDAGNSSQMCNIVPEDVCIHEHEIASSITEANGGINYSNEDLERQWRTRQMGASLNATTSAFNRNLFDEACCDYKNSKAKLDDATSTFDINTNKKYSMEEEESILKKCKLNKNAVIRGLLKNHIISIKDLQIPNGRTNGKHESNANIQNKSSSSQIDKYETNSVTLVQCPDDPDVFIQPLQAHGTIDEAKHKNIDFTVPHIGKKKIVTSRRFFVDTDDADFQFVKKDTKEEPSQST